MIAGVCADTSSMLSSPWVSLKMSSGSIAFLIITLELRILPLIIWNRFVGYVQNKISPSNIFQVCICFHNLIKYIFRLSRGLRGSGILSAFSSNFFHRFQICTKETWIMTFQEICKNGGVGHRANFWLGWYHVRLAVCLAHGP